MVTYVPGRAATRARGSVVSADDPVLASKITTPGVPDWAVQRPRITQLIIQGTRWCPLTVLTGPVGAGKTMALASWAASESGPVAWVSLDEYDDGPAEFWPYVVAALRRSGIAMTRTGDAGERAGEHLFLLRLAATLAAQHQPVTLVLDDLHLVTDTTVLRGLDFVLRNAGPGLHLVAASRVEPLLPLLRYRLAGQLAEIQASDLAFSTPEASLLLTQHGCTLPADSLEQLMRQTEGLAAGLRLAAISLADHSDAGGFVTDLSAEDSALTGYLEEEVLNAQPPQVRDVLLCTSILSEISTDVAVELAGDERAAGIWSAAARTNAFIQPIGAGRYRYHSLFANVLRLKLRHEYPGRAAVLHRRAARWYGRNGLLSDAVQHAARAGDWPLAARLAIDDLAIVQLLKPRGGQHLADQFASMPSGQAWTEPAPYLVSAALALSTGRYGSCAAALDAADGVLERGRPDQEPVCRLAAALIRLTAAARTGDLAVAAAAAASTELLLSQVPGEKLTRHPGVRASVLASRGAVELWSGHLDDAACVLQEGVAAQAASAGEDEQARCLGHLALVEALRGRLCHAAELATQAIAVPAGSPQTPARDLDPAVLVALAWVHMERHELREAGSRLRQAYTALAVCPDPLTATVGYLVAACGALAEGRAAEVINTVARARSGRFVPAWLDHKLSLVQSRAFLAAGDIQEALAAATRADGEDSLAAAATLAHAWEAAGDSRRAQRVLAPTLAADGTVPDRVRVYAWLMDARLSHGSGDHARARRSLASALRLAEPEQLRLPFAVERSWIGRVLRRDPNLAGTHRCLLAPALPREQLPAPPGTSGKAVITPDSDERVPHRPGLGTHAGAAQAHRPQLSKRHRPGAPGGSALTAAELRLLPLLSTHLSLREIAGELFLSRHTVKSEVTSLYRKLGVSSRSQAVARSRELALLER
jgi:LuxR family maltose regulon positive regulatory protein